MDGYMRGISLLAATDAYLARASSAESAHAKDCPEKLRYNERTVIVPTVGHLGLHAMDVSGGDLGGI